MKCIEQEFDSNANQTGVQTFKRISQGMNPKGKHVYIYERSTKDRVFGYEVFIPSVKPAGTYPLPGGKEISYTEDFEEYPGASKFGVSAWFCSNLKQAQNKFSELIGQTTAETVETVEIAENESENSAAAENITAETVKHRGRPKVDRPPLTIPEGEFSTKELAEKNGVEYIIASVFLREQKEAGMIKFVREERRAAKGKPTQIFAKAA